MPRNSTAEKMTPRIVSAKPARSKRKAKAVLKRPSVTGWHTSDEDEIQLRRWRGRTEILAVTALEVDQACFGTFRTQSASGGSYMVEIRSLDAFGNSSFAVQRAGAKCFVLPL